MLSMSVRNRAVLGVLTIAGLIILAYFRLHSLDFGVLQPRGLVANRERNLILVALGLCSIVVIPVYIMLFGFAWKYRAANAKARYQPDFDHSRLLESLWWGIPLIIISLLAVITWRSSTQLDPFRSLDSTKLTEAKFC